MARSTSPMKTMKKHSMKTMKKSRKYYVVNQKPKRGKSSTKKDSGCAERDEHKYKSRPSPPYPANECGGMFKIGNDKYLYISAKNSKGIYQWKRFKKSYEIF